MQDRLTSRPYRKRLSGAESQRHVRGSWAAGQSVEGWDSGHGLLARVANGEEAAGVQVFRSGAALPVAPVVVS